MYDRALRTKELWAELSKDAGFWMRETGTALPAAQASGPMPLLGVHEGTAYYLLFNGILGDKRPASRVPSGTLSLTME